ncbi:MAG TPA: DUF4011 domain-containing protein [Micromonosporaceae bacterium]|nr:DUF4011 domain-containing protein [Micromonosporaceae bacterium]
MPTQLDDSPPRVQQWKRALLDLSLRNPLLNLPTRGRGLDLVIPAGALALLDDLIHSGKQLELVPQDAASPALEQAGVRQAQDLEPKTLTRELRSGRRIYAAVTRRRYRSLLRDLQRDALTVAQETGSNYLYLTFGTLAYPKDTGGEAYAPLFLLPVRIEGGIGDSPYHLLIDGSEIASPNYCLIEWLRAKHDVRIPELENPVRDAYGIDIPKTLAAIKSGLAQNELNYRIEKTASLRLLQFSTFQMWRDLTDHWSTFLDNPVVRHLVQSAGASFDDPAGGDADPVFDEAELHLPLPADGPQMQAVALAAHGRSFVLQGPPGTGKSQTITNMIALAVVSGRTVLFVAEKQAALDVVKRRLEKIGLASFALDLHGRKQSLNAIRDQLSEALGQVDYGDDDTWALAEAAYQSRLAPLASYPELVHQPNPAGLSMWSAYEAALAYGDGPTAEMPLDYLAAPAEWRQEVEAALYELPAVAHAAGLRADHPWSLSGRRHTHGLHQEAVAEIAAELEVSRRQLAKRRDVVAVLRKTRSPEELRQLLSAAVLAARGLLPDRADIEQADRPGWDAEIEQLRVDLASFRQSYAAELLAFRSDVFLVNDLAALNAEAQQAAGRLFGRRTRLQEIADRLEEYLQDPSGDITYDEVQYVLARLMAARAEAAILYQRAHTTGGLRLPAGWLAITPQAEAEFAEACRAVRLRRELLESYPEALALFEAGFDETGVDLLDRLVAAWRAWRGVLASGDEEFVLWAGETHWYDAWQRDGSVWRDELAADGLLPLQRWGTLLTVTDAIGAAGLPRFATQLLRAEIAVNDAEEAYQRALAIASLRERSQHGALEHFDADQHDEDVTEFAAVAAALRAELPDRLRSLLVRRRSLNSDEQRDRLDDLAAELRRKRGGMSFRELFQSASDIVLALTPCVLVSPASVANFLAPDAAKFDLVIFDEASQIRVAEAVGAMGRGRAAVIVGDLQQLPPSNTAQAANDGEAGDEDGPTVEDRESILSEAVESGLPQQWLTWHYRSHDESLIAFSNRHYYDNKLSTLPTPGSGGTGGIAWRRVDGGFDRGGSRTNEIEAREIVAEIAHRLREPHTAADSIGVVTFNVQQRDLILNLLEESDDPVIRARLSYRDDEPIFVKNLDNVQGDERDVILFSLAFSTDPQTGRLPLNLGPLSRAGGERRLNVAITRARRQVVLFASFDPADIDLTRTTALGVQHLRAYCELAAAGADPVAEPTAPRPDHPDLIRDEVADAIRARGYEVTTGYGLSDFTVDIAVRAPGSARWQVAIVLDGPQWGQRQTVADRDRVPALLHEIAGWPVVLRFWLPAWIQDRLNFLDRVEAAVKEAQFAPVPASKITPVPFVPYAPRLIGSQRDISALRTDERVQSLVRAAMHEVIAAEGPIEQHRLARLTLAQFGVVKPRPERRAAVLALLEPACLRQHPEAGTFAWPATVDPQSWRGLRTTQQSADRSFAEIPPEEIANAACFVLAERPRWGEDELLRSVRELLGYPRKTEKIDRLLRYGVELAVRSGRVVRENDGSYRTT